MSRKYLALFFSAMFTLIELTAAYADNNQRADIAIVSDLFTDPIPSIMTWKDRISYAREVDASVILVSKKEDKKLAFDIKKLMNKGPCFGTLRETERLYDGYVVHFEADPVQKQCANYVDHAFLIPSYWNPDTKFYLKLYEGPVLKGQVPINIQKVGKKTIIQDSEKEKLEQIYNELEEQMASLHRAKKMDDFMNHPDYERAKPLYNACMRYKVLGEDQESFSRTSYCLCIAQRFAYGGRLPDEELAIYVRNFEELFKTERNNSDVFYSSNINTCKGCRYTTDNRDLQNYCTVSEKELNTAMTYPDMIRLLQKPNPEIGSFKSLKLNFYIDYIEAYSNFCRNTIKNPVKFKYTVTEKIRTSLWEPEISRKLHESITYVEKKYAQKYQQCFDELDELGNTAAKKSILKGQAFRAPTKAGLASTSRSIRNIIAGERKKKAALQKHFDCGCQSNQVQTSYRNLYNLIN